MAKTIQALKCQINPPVEDNWIRPFSSGSDRQLGVCVRAVCEVCGCGVGYGVGSVLQCVCGVWCGGRRGRRRWLWLWCVCGVGCVACVGGVARKEKVFRLKTPPCVHSKVSVCAGNTRRRFERTHGGVRSRGERGGRERIEEEKKQSSHMHQKFPESDHWILARLKFGREARESHVPGSSNRSLFNAVQLQLS